MPLHDYECPKCKAHFEHFCKIKDLEKEVICECGGVAERRIPPLRMDAFKPHWNDRIAWNPVYVESKKHLAELCKTHNLASHYLEGSYNRRSEKRWI